MTELHPNVQQIAEVYRWRPFRRIRNLLDHLDTAYRVLDDTEHGREMAVKNYQRIRMHVRRDGTQKTGLPRGAAEAEAKRLTADNGKPYTVYGCWCGQFHTGYRRRGEDV